MKFLRQFLFLSFITMNVMLLQASSELPNQVQKNDEKVTEYVQPIFKDQKSADLFKSFFGESLTDVSKKSSNVSGIGHNKYDPQSEEGLQAAVRADARIFKMRDDTQFNEVNVQKILVTYSYLNAQELARKLQMLDTMVVESMSHFK